MALKAMDGYGSGLFLCISVCLYVCAPSQPTSQPSLQFVNFWSIQIWPQNGWSSYIKRDDLEMKVFVTQNWHSTHPHAPPPPPPFPFHDMTLRFLNSRFLTSRIIPKWRDANFDLFWPPPPSVMFIGLLFLCPEPCVLVSKVESK